MVSLLEHNVIHNFFHDLAKKSNFVLHHDGKEPDDLTKLAIELLQSIFWNLKKVLIKAHLAEIWLHLHFKLLQKPIDLFWIPVNLLSILVFFLHGSNIDLKLVPVNLIVDLGLIDLSLYIKQVDTF